ncbi:hypothetical protein LOD99_8462 [Oopsacas minuta]|uniref:Uncharacterized protein n=1 Tax=Oopsacas minuta TaxID=111878 RepID=A0AAV7JGH9_9METZ|nr:hypothetical protein LOD99_8462 [Oopsacas minuta]
MEHVIAADDIKVNIGIVADIVPVYQEFETKMLSETLPVLLKDSLKERYYNHLQKITLLVIDVLPIDYKDSLFYIERTLAEPSLYSLNGLIMWKETAEKKIVKIQKLNPNLPKQIESVIVKRYECQRLRLKEEILKMGTYPIPEPWRSDCMRRALRHAIEGEFIFYVDPEIEEDMKPLNPSKRDQEQVSKYIWRSNICLLYIHKNNNKFTYD